MKSMFQLRFITQRVNIFTRGNHFVRTRNFNQRIMSINNTKTLERRQFSLNCDTPLQEKRKLLKKQFSEEIVESTNITKDINTRKGLTNKPKILDTRKPIKIAWEEECSAPKEITVKKYSRVSYNDSTSNIENFSKCSSLLNSQSELIDRVKETIMSRDNKPNLNIFLATKTRTTSYDNTFNVEDGMMDISDTDNSKTTEPFINIKNDAKLRQNFKNRRANTIGGIQSDVKGKEYNDTILIVPVSPEREKFSLLFSKTNAPSDEIEKMKSDPNEKLVITHQSKPIESVTIRPSTATAKREMFQKKVNVAFNSIVNEKPVRPLIRSSSAPNKPRVKFQTHKRKLKTTKRNSLEPTIRNCEFLPEDSKVTKSKKKLNRTTPTNGIDIITMISLVSPAGSDTEEILETEKEKDDISHQLIVNMQNEENTTSEEKERKSVTLRKTVKSVSFQQSTIHAVRSFSASFPSKRITAARAVTIKNSTGTNCKQNCGKIPNQERRTVINSFVDEEREPKRRLMKTGDMKNEESLTTCQEGVICLSLRSKENDNSIASEFEEECINDEILVENNVVLKENVSDRTKFQTSREKECWKLYHKMTNKGINVSYDTILRGLLTPTEYRAKQNCPQTEFNQCDQAVK